MEKVYEVKEQNYMQAFKDKVYELNSKILKLQETTVPNTQIHE